MDKEELLEQREYAWKYFSLHAEQRLKTFHFFIMLSAIISGAIFTISKDMPNISLASPICYLLSFLAFIFWKLDQRNKELIKHGELALKEIEEHVKQKYEIMKEIYLFSNEIEITNNKNKFPKAPLIYSHMSYSDCFNLVFFIFGFGGIVIGSLLLMI